MASTRAVFTPCVASPQIRLGSARFAPPLLASVTRPVPRSSVMQLGGKSKLAPRRFSVAVRAQKKTSSSPEVEEITKQLTDKWEGVEDKPTFLLYSAGFLAGLWVVSSVVGAVNGLPLLPKFLELIGLVYSAWFVYRYLLFKSSREELISDFDALKKKVSGEDDA